MSEQFDPIDSGDPERGGGSERPAGTEGRTVGTPGEPAGTAGQYWGYPPPGWGGPPWAPAPPARPHHRWWASPLAVAALFVATVAAGIGIGHSVWSPHTSNPVTSSTSTPSTGGASHGGPADVSSIAAKVDPALVDINVTFDGEDPGAGTGIVLTSNGEVLTNNHVVEGATSISVTDLGNGKTYGATVAGYDVTQDVAVLQLKNASGLHTAKIADSSKVKVGDDVVAIGNAGGTGGTPSAAGGTVTALGQAITASDDVTGGSENLTGLIETDADIQPGDSGGSLVNTSGEVIGMDTAAGSSFALSSQTDQGYAIPIAKALSIASQIESGRASSTLHVGPTAYLGVMVTSGSSQTSPGGGGYEGFGGFGGYGSASGGQGAAPTTSGAVVGGVVSGTPAAEAGLAEGDVITSIAGQSVTSASDLTTVMQTLKPGQQVQLGWTDTAGTAHTLTITLGSGPAQ